MGYLSATWDSLLATLRQARREPTTVEYPHQTRPRAERLRASFALTKDEHGDENCIGCQKCEHICPSDIIRVKKDKHVSPVTGKSRGYASDFTINLQACIVCELCVQVCPTDAIIMTREQEAPGFQRTDLTLTMDKLYRNFEKRVEEGGKTAAWSKASLLWGMQEGKPPGEGTGEGGEEDDKAAAKAKAAEKAKAAREAKAKAAAAPEAAPAPAPEAAAPLASTLGATTPGAAPASGATTPDPTEEAGS